MDYLHRSDDFCPRAGAFIKRLNASGAIRRLLFIWRRVLRFGIAPATTLIARWFVVYRARALSIASTGLSVGGMLITPLSAEWVASMDIGPATQLMAVVYALGIIPLTIWLVRSRPEDVNEGPDGLTQAESRFANNGRWHPVRSGCS